MGLQYASAREFFEAAREAARDAERIRRQLDRMDASASSLGGGGFEPRVRGTRDPDAIGRRVAALADQGERLRARQDEDYRLIDAACEVLYGTDSDAGLWSLVGWPADAIYHHYLALRTWEETGRMMGYSVQHVRRQVLSSFDVMDAYGMTSTASGTGMAT